MSETANMTTYAGKKKKKKKRKFKKSRPGAKNYTVKSAMSY